MLALDSDRLIQLGDALLLTPQGLRGPVALALLLIGFFKCFYGLSMVTIGSVGFVVGASIPGILGQAGLLSDEGTLRGDVGLVSIGDHFDHPGNIVQAARSGLAVLRWLAEHPPDQAVILAGNHDLCRVMELCEETNDSFARARALGLEIQTLERRPCPLV